MRHKAYAAKAYRDAKRRLKGLPCIYCGAPSDTVEHMVSLIDGGDNSFENLKPACRACNSREGQKLSVARRKKKNRWRSGRW